MSTARLGVTALIVIVVLCAGLLFPALQARREAQRRMQCANNVKVLCLGLQNYHDTYLYLPYGARNRTAPPDYDQISWGRSWLASVMIFCEARRLPLDIEEADFASAENDYNSPALRKTVHNARIGYMLCPSSPLPVFQTLSGQQLVVPSYAGIMGAAPFEQWKWRDVDFTDVQGPEKEQDTRIVAGPYDGLAAGNGMLCINECFPDAAAIDGKANTIIVGEVSDWYYTDQGQCRNPALSIGDAGDGASDAAGWLAGNNLGFSRIASGFNSGKKAQRQGQLAHQQEEAIDANRVFNSIAIRHPVGMNNRLGTKDSGPDWGTQGIGRCGFNNPLLSAHPAGAMAGYLDGHVALMTKGTSLKILQRLAGRDENMAADE